MITRIKTLLFFVLLLSAVSTKLIAGEVPKATKRIGGHGSPQVVTGQNSAIDSVQLSGVPDGYPLAHADKRVLNTLSFGMDYNSPEYPKINDNKKVKIKVHVHCFNNSNACFRDTSFTMEIKHNPNDTLSEIVRSTYIQGNAYKLKFSIDSIFVNDTIVDSLPSFLFLDATISAERLFNFSANVNTPISLNPIDTLNIDCDQDNLTDELEVSWPQMAGAEEYQLEWTYVNDYDIISTQYLSPTNLQYNFRNNSTRITTNGANNSYRIPLLFEHGYIVFRVRALGFNTNNPPELLTGTWSINNESGSIASLGSDDVYYVWSAHESNKNWQLSTTFAEQGKKKEVISYFDGSQRNRQTVTKINSDNSVIVGENIYDFQGRPAISVLPTPVIPPSCEYINVGPVIKFHENYNLNLQGNQYSKSDFDINTTDSCSVNTPGMDTISGSSNYYSSYNPDKNKQQAFVPDAELYPFSQVEYTPDNTGRIRRQGGVGPLFQLDGNHETKYYYGQPNQIQLDRLFGTEVGDATHYKKNMVVDANGQVSVTYLDQEGRTIATSLSSEAPLNLLPIKSEEASAIPTYADLFNKNANGISNLNTVNTDLNSIQFNTELLVSSVSDYSFNYNLSVDPFRDSCLNANICFSCVYDLEIKVLNECGANMPGIITPSTITNKVTGRFIPAVGNSPISFILNCSDSTTYTDSIKFTLQNLPIGNYQVIKTLTLNEDAINFYVAAYLDSTNNHCFKTLHDFQQGAIDTIDFSGCVLTCETCLNQLGTKDDYISRGEGSADDYDRDYEECKDLCPTPVDPCEVAYEMMLGDMSPEGQYGETQDFQGHLNVSSNPLSVFNTQNHLPINALNGTGNWKNPLVIINGITYPKYVQANNSNATVTILRNPNSQSKFIPEVDDDDNDTTTISLYATFDATTNTWYTTPEKLSNVEDFIASWNISWARSLVKYHPEYFYYENCIAYKTKCDDAQPFSSAGFDSLMLLANSFGKADSLGLILQSGSVFSINHWTDNTPSNNDNGTATDPSDDFINPSDPMSFCTVNYGNYASQLANKINNYTTVIYDGTTYNYSLIQAAAISVRCGNIINVVPAAYCSDFGTDLYPNTVPNYQHKNDSIRNAEWLTVRAFYMSVKQNLQIQRADQLAIANHAVNDCIGNSSNYNPASSGMFTYTTPVFPNTSNYPYYDPAQPCSHQNMAFYANKQQVFPDPTETLVNDPNQTAYQLYLQTGQCPSAINLQSLLSEMAGTNNLDNTNFNLQGAPTYGAITLSVTNNNPAPSILPTIWSASNVTANSLQFSINDQNNPALSNCVNTLTTSNPLFTTWDDIQNFTSLHALGTYNPNGTSNYQVSAYVMAPPVGGGNPVIQLMDFSGTTCINIANCNFPLTCELTPVAKDIVTLMNALSNDNTGASFNSTSPINISAYVTNAIKNSIGALSSNLMWEKAPSSAEFFIKDTDPTNLKSLRINFPNQVLTFPQTYITPASPGQNILDLTVVENSTGTTDEITGITFEILTNGTDPTGLITSVCGRPDPISCTQEGHEVLSDLEDVLKNVLLNNAPTNINLFANQFFTPLLQANFAATTTATTSTYSLVPILDANQTIIGHRNELTINTDTTECPIIIYHAQMNGANTLDINNLVSIGEVIAYGNADAEGNFHDFKIPAVFAIGSGNVTDTLYGSSCLPLLNCVLCVSLENEPPASSVSLLFNLNPINNARNSSPYNVTSALSACEIMYDKYLYDLQNINDTNNVSCNDLVPISYLDFQASGFCCNADAYFELTLFVEQSDTACPVNLPTLISPASDCDPSFVLENSSCGAILNYIESAYYHSPYYAATGDSIYSGGRSLASLSRVNSSLYCSCVNSYYEYLLPYLDSVYDPLLPQVEEITMFGPCVPIPELTCEEKYNQYLIAIQGALTHLQVTHPSFSFTPLTFQQFEAGRFCDCSQLNFENYLSDLESITLGKYDQAPTSELTTLLNINNTCNTDPCANRYTSYLTSIQNATSHILVIYPSFSFTPLTYSQFQEGSYCECARYAIFDERLRALVNGVYDNLTQTQLTEMLSIQFVCDACGTNYSDYSSIIQNAIAHIQTIDSSFTYTPLTFQQFQDSGFCVCKNFAQYLKLLDQVKDGDYDTASITHFISLLDIINTCNLDPCFNVYNDYVSSIEAAVTYIQTHTAFTNFNITPISEATFQANKFCQCGFPQLNVNAVAITNGLYNNYTIDQLTNLLNLFVLCHEIPPDPCEEAYTAYISAIKTSEPLPLLSHDEFIAGGYCNCIDQFLGIVNSFYSGYYGEITEQQFLQLIDITQICTPPPPPPCTTPPLPPVVSVVPPTSTPCQDMLVSNALANAQNAYENYIQSLTTVIRGKYIAHCMKPLENFLLNYNEKEYHFTLYYYDQAGNLIKTIPPEGVRSLPVNSFATVPNTADPNYPSYLNKQKINADRTFGTRTIFTDHKMATTYEYNSLNQLVRQYMPDHDPMDIFDITLPNGLDNRLQTTAIQMVNENTGYLTGFIPVLQPSGIVRNRGYLYTTYDGGATWQKVNGLTGADMKKVFMVNGTAVGYAVGEHGVVLKTEDNGNSWDMLYTYAPNQIVKNLNDVYFIDDNNGVIVGDDNRILITNDGGATFTFSSVNVNEQSISDSIDFTSITYVHGTSIPSYLIGAKVQLNGELYGAIFNSVSGTNWTREDKIIQPTLTSIDYFDATSAYAVGQDGTLLRTSNNGATWHQIPTGLHNNLKKIYFKDRLTGVAMVESTPGNNQLFITYNGGFSWSLFSEPENYYNDIYEYYHKPTTYGAKLVAVGKDGLIQRIILKNNTPGGFVALQTPLMMSTGIDFTAVWASYDNAGFTFITAAASDGLFYYTKDFGNANLTWNTESGNSANINATNYVTQIRGIKKYGNGNENMRGVALTLDGHIVEIGYLSSNSQFEINPILINPTIIQPNGLSHGFTTLVADSANLTHPNTSYVYAYSNHIQNNNLNKITLPLTYSVAASNSNIYSLSANAGVNAIDLEDNKFILVGTNGQIHTLNTTTPPPSPFFVDRKFNTRPPVIYDLFSQSNQVIAVGVDGMILNRSVLGNIFNWKSLITGTNTQLNAAAFSALTNSYIILGDEGLVLSGTTSTTTFNNTIIAINTSENLNDLLVNSNKVYIAGNHGKAFYNSNYPVASFNLIGNTSSLQNLYSIAINTQNKVIISGENNLMMQVSGTSSSKIKTMYPGKLTDVHFSDPNNGHVIGLPFTIRKTNNGCNSFDVIVPDNNNSNTPNLSSLPPNVNTSELTKVWTIDPNYAILIANDDRYIAVIKDAQVQQQNPDLIPATDLAGKQLYSINFNKYNPLNGYIGGDGTKMRGIAVVPTGNTYSFTLNNNIPTINSASSIIKDIQIVDNGLVMVAGQDGLLRIYDNLNNDWMSTTPISYDVAIDPNTNFNTVYMHDNQFGYVAGNNGAYYKFRLNYLNSTLQTINCFKRPLADNLNINAANLNLNAPEITAMAFANVTNGVWGGNYGSYAVPSTHPYVRLIKDESDRYSTRFWYDKLGRMVVSQNTKQYKKESQAFSYTLYDALGRIVEVGEKTENVLENTSDPLNSFETVFGTMVSSYFNPKTISDTKLLTWIGGNGARKEVTRTYYDETDNDILANLESGFTQENLRKRVASVTYEDIFDGNDATYEHATHYSYDIHGNVKTMFNENQKLAKKFPDDVNNTLFAQQKNKRIDYDYDLISGKVNEVSYQDTKADQWHHRYNYDDDNRITEVETSKDKILWQKDAKYLYYKHGPLARTELGENLVQGVDYVYTLQGWIKGVNSNSLSSQSDPGMDNFGMNTTPSLNQNFAKDVYGYTLGYFDGDYQPIDMIKWNTSNRFEADKTGSQLLANRNNLYNGNIGSMVTTIVDPNNPSVPLPLGSAYKYDQLNRIILGTSYNNLDLTTNTWGAGTLASNLYRNEFVYDANGNILNQKRFNNVGQMFDNLEYKYDFAAYSQPNGANGGTDMRRNRLYHVNDQIGLESLETDDIDDMGSLNVSDTLFKWGNSTNYDYTPIGELKKDTKEGIVNIEWTVYGKIKEVTRLTSHGMQTLKFDYDASGNRIAKHVYSATGTWKKSTYYSRDAQGNVMSVYEQFFNPTIAAGSYAQVEKHIYGSSRLGMEKTFVELIDNNGPGPDPDNLSTARLMIIDAPGKRVYELTNHLGNVLATVSDFKYPIDLDDDNVIDGFRADVYTANDYSAFGAPLKGRKFDKTICVPQTIVTPLVNEDFNGSNTAGFTSINNGVIGIAGNRLRVNKPQINPLPTFGMQKTFTVAANSTYLMTFDLGVMSASPISVKIINTANGQVIQSLSYNADAFVSLNFSTSTAGTYRLELSGNSGTNNNPKRMFNIDNLFIEETNNTPLCVNYGSYRYSFNGKEKDDETYGDGNAYDFDARMLDPRLGRWLSIDPQSEKYPYYTPYLSFGDNPIIFTDPQGETLKVAITGNIDNDFIARRDIESLMPDGKSTLISFADDGTVGFTVTKEQMAALAAKDPGIGIVYNMVMANENYLYEVNDITQGKLPDGKIITKSLFAPINENQVDEQGRFGAENLQMENMSKTAKYGGDKSNKNAANSLSPMDANIDGHIVLDPALVFIVKSDVDNRPKNRDALVFHELWESYYRTTLGLAYNDVTTTNPADGTTITTMGAHNSAIVKQDLLDPTDRRRDGASGKAALSPNENLDRSRNSGNTKSKPIPKQTSKD